MCGASCLAALCKAFALKDDVVHEVVAQRFELRPNYKYVVSVGSVGQPRDYDPRASYVLFDGKHSYTLSDQRTPEQFAGLKVRVVGTLDAKTNTIQVDSIRAAK